VDELKHQMDLKDKEMNLLRKEADGLRDDNERLNRMYLLVQKEAFSKPAEMPKEYRIQEKNRPPPTVEGSQNKKT